VFDLQSDKISKIKMNINESTYKYNSYIIYNEWIYLFPLGNVPFIKYNMKTSEMITLEKWNNEIKKYKLNIVAGYSIFSAAYRLDDKIYAPLGLDNVILEFDILDGSIDAHRVGESTGYISIQYDGENFWLLPREIAPVLCWNPITGEEKFFEDFYIETEKIPFSTSIIMDRIIWIFVKNINQVIKVDIDTLNKIETINLEIENMSDYIITGCFNKVIQKSNNEILAFAGDSKQIILINTNTNIIKTIPVRLDGKMEDEKLSIYLITNDIVRYNSENHIIYESEMITIDNYIKDIEFHYDSIKTADFSEVISKIGAPSGEKIHRSIQMFYENN